MSSRVSPAGEEAGAAALPATDHRRLRPGQLRHAVHQRARAADPRRRVSPAGPRGPLWGLGQGQGQGRWRRAPLQPSLRLCPQGRHKEDRPVRVRGVRVHQPATALHRGVRVRRRAVDTPVNDPRLRRCACMPGRTPRDPHPAPRVGQPRIARPRRRRTCLLCPRRWDPGDRVRGRHGPSISKVHTFHRNGRPRRRRLACKARGINVRWCRRPAAFFARPQERTARAGREARRPRPRTLWKVF